MIGSSVRSLYVKGKGYPCFVSVEQDGTGLGISIALAVAWAIGGTKGGAISSSAREETAMDLFAGVCHPSQPISRTLNFLPEQALWPNIIMLFR